MSGTGRRVLLDVTSLAREPYRSGIQRVEREAIRHWPADVPLALTAFGEDGVLRELPGAGRAALLAGGEGGASFEDEQERLRPLLEAAMPLGDAPAQVLNLELFYEAWRADAYKALCRTGCRVQWLVYDFLPWLRPELFPQGTTKNCMEYLRALREVPQVAFISAQTRADYEGRVMHGAGRAGPVLPLGADGLGLERQTWSPERRDIVLIGTIEERKNPQAALEGFRRLWAEGKEVRLVCAGRIDPPMRATVRAAAVAAGSRMTVLEHASDDALRATLRRARAVLVTSEAEGFGLPPYEAVQCGIPAIASALLPSMGEVPAGAWIRLEQITPASIAAAVTALLDDDAAARLWAGVAKVELPGWAAFARDLAAWAAAAA